MPSPAFKRWARRLLFAKKRKALDAQLAAMSPEETAVFWREVWALKQAAWRRSLLEPQERRTPHAHTDHRP